MQLKQLSTPISRLKWMEEGIQEVKAKGVHQLFLKKVPEICHRMQLLCPIGQNVVVRQLQGCLERCSGKP